MAPKPRRKNPPPAPVRPDPSWALNSAISETGDLDAAMHMVGATIDRMWVSRESLARLEQASALDEKQYRTMGRAQRRAFLSDVVRLGIMPRAAIDPETRSLIEAKNGLVKIIFEPVSPEFRKECIDMLNKMDGTYIERKEVAVAGQPRLSREVEVLMDSILDAEGVLDI